MHNKVDSSNECAVKFTISYARDAANFKVIFTFGGEIIKNAAHTEAMHQVLSTVRLQNNCIMHMSHSIIQTTSYTLRSSTLKL